MRNAPADTNRLTTRPDPSVTQLYSQSAQKNTGINPNWNFRQMTPVEPSRASRFRCSQAPRREAPRVPRRSVQALRQARRRARHLGNVSLRARKRRITSRDSLLYTSIELRHVGRTTDDHFACSMLLYVADPKGTAVHASFCFDLKRGFQRKRAQTGNGLQFTVTTLWSCFQPAYTGPQRV